MKELLLEFLASILDEADDDFYHQPVTYIGKDGKTRTATARTIKSRGHTHPGWMQYQALLQKQKPKQAVKSPITKNKQQAKQGVATAKTTAVNKTKPKKTNGTVPATGGIETLNSNNLAQQIRDGIVAPGNDFSRYSEAVSSFMAKYIVDNPDASDEQIMETLTRLDCDSKTFSSSVSATIPKRFAAEYKNIKSSGAFERGCSKSYSEGQNRARFMTMVVAKAKASRMETAIETTGLTGVNVDSFSGDQASLSSLKEIVNASTGTIYTETGEELTKDAALNFIKGFGTAKFPADTAMVGKDANGNMILIGFSDKKDLQAIINNSTVTKEFERTSDLLKTLLTDEKITQEEYEGISEQLKKQQTEFSKQEAELKKITASPAASLVELAETSPKKLQKYIDQAKNLSSGSDPEKYWNARIGKFQRAAEKKATPSNEQEHLQWLRKSGWDGKSPVSDKMAITAFAYKMQDMIERGEEDIPKDDQEVLFRLDVVDRTEMVEQIGQIRKNALDILQQSRETLNQVSVQGIPLGTLIDGVRAWKGLHLDMGEFKGALTMVAEDVVVDYKAIQDCMQGLRSMGEFAKNLQINTKNITSREYGVVTGQNIEVFSISPKGERLNVGVRSIRSKEGLLGKLQTTWTYHPDFQSCLAGKSK